MASDVSAFERKPLSSEPSHREPDAPSSQADAQLRAEIRLLGRILGDTVRDQEGDDVFDLVEAIRQASIRFHRDEDIGARHELEAMLDGRSIAETVRIVRAISNFSHHANIAEDQNHIRQTRIQSGAGLATAATTLAGTVERAREAGVSVQQLRVFFDDALVSPVLTAHPTEVRRKSTIDREMEIATLLEERDRTQMPAEELADNDEQLRQCVLYFYVDELRKLYGELSLARDFVLVSDELLALNERSPAVSAHRGREPYRRAVNGVLARLKATAKAFGVRVSGRPVPEGVEPYESVEAVRADLDIINRSLIEHGSGVIARGRLRRLRRAVDCFGFHLARLDLRQNSAVHERTVAELFEAVAPGTDYLSLSEDERCALLARELHT